MLHESLQAYSKNEKTEKSPLKASHHEDAHEGTPIYWPLVMVAASTILASNVTFSIVVSFLPQEAQHRGIDDDGQGVISAAQKLGTICSAGFVGPLCRRFGNTAVLITASLLHAAAVLVNGILGGRINDAHTFLAVFLLARFVQGAANGQADGAAQGMVVRAVPLELLTRVVTILEGARGLGLAIGPITGSLLYSWCDGMLVPYCLCAGLLLLPLLVLICIALCVADGNVLTILSIHSAKAQNFDSVCTLLRRPLFTTVLLAQLSFIAGLGLVEATAASVWARPPFDMTTITIGAVFAAGGSVTILCAGIQGASSRWLETIPCLLQLALAGALMGAGFLTMGLTNSAAGQTAGFVAGGSSGYGIAVVAGSVALVKTGSSFEGSDDGMCDDQQDVQQRKAARAESISTVLVYSFSIGLFIGSTAYAKVQQATSWSITAQGVAVLLLTIALGLLITAACWKSMRF